MDTFYTIYCWMNVSSFHKVWVENLQLAEQETDVAPQQHLKECSSGSLQSKVLKNLE